MQKQTLRVSRRRAVAAGVGVAAAMGLPSAARLAAAPAIRSGGGIAGGGMVETAEGVAQFSVFASRLELENDDSDEVVFGRVQWVDLGWEDEGLTLESTEIIDYGPIPGDDEDAREIRGMMSANGEGNYPFTMRLVDVGPPGSVEDVVALTVGAAATDATPVAEAPDGEFAYSVEGIVAAGGIQLLSFDTPGQG